jgi:hypothetical protein
MKYVRSYNRTRLDVGLPIVISYQDMIGGESIVEGLNDAKLNGSSFFVAYHSSQYVNEEVTLAVKEEFLLSL